ncbi:hypothetical protein BpHYR1_039989 [Brachionus plicatilis]|uniref:Uncharacterized protein n=1 Tax=Brachionus plicatilis TaxID=10195 RepID=A0A3M7SIU2_BRAPC|nr:hypothetical protein BpHYR1_039989 [Brachionus plicatilis]
MFGKKITKDRLGRLAQEDVQFINKRVCEFGHKLSEEWINYEKASEIILIYSRDMDQYRNEIEIIKE